MFSSPILVIASYSIAESFADFDVSSLHASENGLSCLLRWKRRPSQPVFLASSISASTSADGTDKSTSSSVPCFTLPTAARNSSTPAVPPIPPSSAARYLSAGSSSWFKSARQPSKPSIAAWRQMPADNMAVAHSARDTIVSGPIPSISSIDSAVTGFVGPSTAWLLLGLFWLPSSSCSPLSVLKPRTLSKPKPSASILFMVPEAEDPKMYWINSSVVSLPFPSLSKDPKSVLQSSSLSPPSPSLSPICPSTAFNSSSVSLPSPFLSNFLKVAFRLLIISAPRLRGFSELGEKEQ
mmetsp:Transcript_53449/g.125400  ORF Transcript_53449/g.125400 Transcript_53449/m.125400 type:complete len:295 (-) Transcript_53449:1189-2073(-)